MDFDYVHYMLTEGRKEQAVSTVATAAYRMQLAKTLGLDRTPILVFRNIPVDSASLHQQPRRYIPELLRWHGTATSELQEEWMVRSSTMMSGSGHMLWRLTKATAKRPEEHESTIKALAWCPFQSNWLASGGGGEGGDGTKFWNNHTGAFLNSVDTGSLVSALIWNKKERELLSSHVFNWNQLTHRKYPSMLKITELKHHTSNVLFMTQINSSKHADSSGN